MKNKKIKTIDGETFWVTDRLVGCSVYIFDSTAKANDNDFRILLVRRKTHDGYGKWSIPCGYLDADETGEECALRELYEETGLKLESLSMFDASTRLSEHKQHVIFRYFGTAEENKLVSNETDETFECKFVPVHEINRKYEMAFWSESGWRKLCDYLVLSSTEKKMLDKYK